MGTTCQGLVPQPCPGLVFNNATNLVIGFASDRLTHESARRNMAAPPKVVNAYFNESAQLWFHVHEKYVDRYRWEGHEVIEVYVR